MDNSVWNFRSFTVPGIKTHELPGITSMHYADVLMYHVWSENDLQQNFPNILQSQETSGFLDVKTPPLAQTTISVQTKYNKGLKDNNLMTF